MTDKIKAFKAFNKDWTCRGFQYELGKTYHHEGEVVACDSGFHSCEYPLDIFKYYNPCSSVFAEVTLSGKISKDDDDTKVASEYIELVKELDVNKIIEESIAYTTSRCDLSTSEHATGYYSASSATGYQSASSATGDHSASSATGYHSASSATGYYSASSATGDQSASSATGYYSASLTTGHYSSSKTTNDTKNPIYAAAISTGYCGRVMGTEGDALFLVERDGDGCILKTWSGIVGKGKVKPNTWYTLKDGKLTIALESDYE